MLLRLIRWLRGYVGFSAVGKFPERFINLVNYRGVRCRCIMPGSGGLSGEMDLYDYKRIRPLARTAGVRLRCTYRRGLPFFVRRYSARKGLLVGAVLALALMGFLSCFIWDVNLHGAEHLGTAHLYKILNDNGVRVGAWKGSYDLAEVERQLLLRESQIGWVSVNIVNNAVNVEIKERKRKPALEDVSYPCNIKAAEDGVITNIIVNNGTAAVKRGSAVTRNTLLISAVMEGKHGRLDYVHAMGKVMADVRVRYELSVPKTKRVIIPEQNYTERSNASVLGITFPFALSPDRGEPFNKTYSVSSVSVNNVRLPLNITSERSYLAAVSETALDARQARAALKKSLALRELFRSGNGVVKRRKITFGKTRGAYTLTADLVLNRSIGTRQRIEVSGG